MTDQQSIEREIRRLLDVERDAISLSNKLFSRDWLFHQMAPSEAERRALVSSPLFREAQRRLGVLKRQEAEDFGRQVDQIRLSHPCDRSLYRLERI